MAIAFTIIAFLLGGYAAIQLAAPFLPALTVGAIVAVMLRPFHRRLKKLPMPHWSSALLLCLLAYVGVLFPLGYLIWDSLSDGIAYFSNFDWGGLVQQLPLEKLQKLLPMSPEQMRAQALELAKELSTLSLSFLGQLLRAIPENIFQLVFSLLAAYFFLHDGPRFSAWAQRQIPMKPRESERVLKSLTESTNAVVGATGIAALIQAFLMCIGFAVTGVPRPLFFFVVTFFAAFVPVVGSAPVWIGGAIYLYFNAPLWAFILMLCFGGVISLSDNIVKPLVIGGRSPLHPLVTLIAVFGGLKWIGPVGLFLGPIVAALLLTLLEIWSSSSTRDKLTA